MKLGSKRYRTDLEGRGTGLCACFMGMAFFLRCVYYFGFTRTEEVGALELIFMLVLPMALEGAFMVLLKGVRMDAPGLYGILAVGGCLLLIFQCFLYESILRMVVEILLYLVCGGLMLGVSAGYLSKELAMTAFFTTAAVRFLLILKPYILSLRLVALLPEAAGLCVVLGLGCLAWGFQLQKKKA